MLPAALIRGRSHLSRFARKAASGLAVQSLLKRAWNPM